MLVAVLDDTLIVLISTSMQGFYTKAEAANILGCSIRTIGNHLRSGKLRRLEGEHRIYIPREDVENLYNYKVSTVPPSRQEFEALQKEVRSLRNDVEVLKSGLGFGARRPVRSEADLLLLRSELLQDLARPGWTQRRMMEVADLMTSLREEEVELLCKHKGDRAWSPLFDLVRRMISHVEEHETYPANGLDILGHRLVQAQERLYGLINASIKIRTPLGNVRAKRILESVNVKPGALEAFIARYIVRNAQK